MGLDNNDGDFFAERTAWVGSDDGLLALDRNGNGVIDDITELFGAPGVSGFEELSALDENGDGVVDASDAQFTDLSVWRDLNQDGRTDDGELFSLADLGITSLGANGTPLGGPGTDGIETPTGNFLRAEASFTRADGTTGRLTEAIFDTDPLDTRYKGDNDDICRVNFRRAA